MHAVSRRSALLGSPYCRAVRDFLDKWLPLHPDFDAFCIDHFTKIARQFGAGWDLLSKQNLLINTIPSEQLLTALRLHAVKEPNALGELTEIQRLLSPEEQQRQALSAQLDQLCEAKAQLLSQGLVNTELDEKIRNLKRLFRRTPQLQDGEILGERYKLLSLLGRGGFARVYQAFDLQTKSLVAVKVLHSESSDDPRRLARFERGARQMEQLNHPHIVRVLTGPAEHDGFHYFVMEYLSSGDLAKAIKDNLLSSIDKLRIILEVGAALRFAHERHLIHRDVKPENILLNNTLRAKLTDFDLVWAADTTGGTHSKAGFGTYLYAAPEQLADAGKITASADVYSLAMLAIFLMIGKIPIWFREYRHSVIYTLSINQNAQRMLDHCTHSEPIYRPTLNDLIISLATNWPLNSERQLTQRSQLIQQYEQYENSYKATIIDPFRTSKAPLIIPPLRSSTTESISNQKTQPQAVMNNSSFFQNNTLDPVETDKNYISLRKFSPFSATIIVSILIVGYFVINLLSNQKHDEKILEEIERKRQKELEEQRFSTLYEKIELASNQSDVDEVIKTAKEIPAHSMYFNSAKQKYEAALPIFIQNHLKAAAVAREQKNCTELTRQLQQILDIDPHSERALAEKAKECKPHMSEAAATFATKKSRTSKSLPMQSGASAESDSLMKEVLMDAKAALVIGHYEKAVNLCLRILKEKPTYTKAQRLLAEAACHSRSVPLIQKSFQEIDGTGKPYFRDSCQKEGIVWVGSEFVIVE